MAIKLIAIDMDGTLLLPDHTISPAVKAAIAAARERGVNVVLTTGRPYAGVHSYLKELHMEQPGDYCITYNGALVQKAGDGSTVAQTALSYDDYRFLEQLSREVGSHFHALDRNTLYTANRDISYYTVHESYVATIPLVFCEAEKMDPEIQLLKVMMIDEPAILDQAIARIPAEVKEKYTVLKSAPYFLEILDKRVNKGTGVKSLADALGIKPEEIMAIGDQDGLKPANDEFDHFLTAKKVSHEYVVGSGAHEWDFWDRYLLKALNWLPLTNQGAGVNSGHIKAN